MEEKAKKLSYWLNLEIFLIDIAEALTKDFIFQFVTSSEKMQIQIDNFSTAWKPVFEFFSQKHGLKMFCDKECLNKIPSFALFLLKFRHC